MSNIRRSEKRSARHPERIEFARDQRKQANEFARDLWQMVRASQIRGQKFRREHPIPPYTVDFVCLALALIVEVDGEHHFTEEGKRRDEKRDQFLREKGFEVLRFDGYERDAKSIRRQKTNRRCDRQADRAAPPPLPTPLSAAPSPPAPLPQTSLGERGAREEASDLRG
jgi:very-short-patch-repair endonuclease